MPKSMSPAILIRVDAREERSGIPAILASLPQVQLERVELEVGDYDVAGNPCRVFERKTATDFIISIEDGRIFEQLQTLIALDFSPLLLLEGDPLSVTRSQMHPEAIRGALTYIAAGLHVPILPSSGPENSARLIYSTARQCQVALLHRAPRLDGVARLSQNSSSTSLWLFRVLAPRPRAP